MAYSEKEITKVFNAICDRIENGESLRSVLRDKDMPSSRTFFKWVDNDANKVKQYERATTLRAEVEFDKMFDIADDGTNDYVKKDVNGNVIETVNKEHIQRSRLRIDTRKWALARMNPKKYGEKLETKNTNLELQPKIITRDDETNEALKEFIDNDA